MLKILIAEDHALVRAGFSALIKNLEGFEVAAEAEDGHQALELIEKHHPQVVLMDIAMPGLNGLEAVSRINKKFPEVKVIILSMHANEEYVIQALRNGARGYLLKDAGTAELELAIRAVMRGETYLSPVISRQVVDDYVRRIEGDNGPLEKLTPRQREILQLIAEGKTTKEIAVKLDLSIKTVDTHRTQLMERLDLHDVAGLVRFAVKMGLVGD
jgi:DNA-binding NarL/FixJ family response regulator